MTLWKKSPSNALEFSFIAVGTLYVYLLQMYHNAEYLGGLNKNLRYIRYKVKSRFKVKFNSVVRLILQFQRKKLLKPQNCIINYNCTIQPHLLTQEMQIHKLPHIQLRFKLKTLTQVYTIKHHLIHTNF